MRKYIGWIAAGVLLFALVGSHKSNSHSSSPSASAASTADNTSLHAHGQAYKQACIDALGGRHYCTLSARAFRRSFSWQDHKLAWSEAAGDRRGQAHHDTRLQAKATLALAATTAPPSTQPAATTTAAAPASQPQSNCSPNYSGACVPDNQGDVNCTDLSATNISVVGTDVYGLDRDGDGVACES